jgi:5'-deoxynucleotidase YfbR-like HD superfamily hydrolase
MLHPSSSQILDLVENVILPFHEIKRQHRLPIGRRRLENDVEHSWTVSILACALAPHIDPQLDTGKISQFALVHDVVEVFAGDTKHFSATPGHKATKTEREQAALARLKQDYPAFSWLSDTIAAYETFDSAEAQFVYAIDKYIAVIYDLLDQGLYLHQVGVDKAKYDQLMVAHRTKAHRHPGVGRYYDEIRNLIDQQPGFLKAPH